MAIGRLSEGGDHRPVIRQIAQVRPAFPQAVHRQVVQLAAGRHGDQADDENDGGREAQVHGLQS